MPKGRGRKARSRKPHVAQEYYDAGSVEDGWNLVRKLKPWAQRAVIGTTRGAPTNV